MTGDYLPGTLKGIRQVLIPIPLENSPDVRSREIWQGVTAAEVGWGGGGVRKGPQVLAIKINLPRKSIKRNPSVKAPPRTAQGSWKRCKSEDGGCDCYMPR